MYMQQVRFPLVPIMGLVVVALLIALALNVAPVLGTHAIERHGEAAFTGRSCHNNPNSTLFYNPTTNRWADVCQTPDGKWAMFIYEKVNGKVVEVTSFVKDKMTSFDKVLRYMQNAGYGISQ
jgi:hypothetical protein